MARTTPGTLRRLLAAVAAATGALGLVAVGAGPAGAAAPAVPAAKTTAWVRAAHLVPGVGTMTIRLVPFSGSSTSDIPTEGVPEAQADGTTRVLERAVGYGGIGDYRQVPSGLYAVTIRPAGSGTDGPPVLTGTFDARPGRAVTLAALGGSKKDPRVEAISDRLSPPPAGTASIRLLPAVPDASTLTVRAQDGPTIATDAPYGRPTPYRSVKAGSWTLDVTTGGGGDPVSASVDVPAGGVFTVFVLADGQGGVVLKPVADAQGAGTMPVSGVQTGLGGLATRPADPVLLGGLGTAGAGLVVLAWLARRQRVAVRPLR
ncbi:DUF4397 domain-containing protein [Phycicoccus flavus]|uniref:DUF4397 domain-containing protein n=1 Tax=Phycicoccus flavus TaxID=2502783 RepID=UPI000FEBA336|nr:DUF4397 domain-containing protein [Phycicoccus flavus]NHA67906.1 DUF4397 domain-containing protein [Phycicoccus flavus]